MRQFVTSKDGTRIAYEAASLRMLARQTHGVSPRALAPVLAEFFA